MAQRKITELFKVNRACGSESESQGDNLNSENKETESKSGLVPCETTQGKSQSNDLELEFKPPYHDISTFSESELKNDDVRHSLLTTKWDNAHRFNFPSRKIYGRERKFNHSWLNDHRLSWMRYSVSDDSVFCVCCVLFGGDKGDKSDKTRLFVRPGVSDWVNLSMLVKRHECSEIHNNCKMRAENFMDVASGSKDSIISKLSSSHKSDVKNTRHVIGRITEVLLLCGRQNIAIRGHTEQKSNFMAILTMLSKGDSILENHLNNPNVKYKYTSPDIQNELLDICAAQIVGKISESAQQSRYFAVLADECTDSATNEQLSVCVRYLVHDGPMLSVREDFLCFINAENTKGQTIANLILDVLQQNGFDLNKLRAQGYDGAANMSGKFRGAQAIIKETAPYATYVHCKAHQLNLALVHSSSLACVRNLMSTVQDIAFSFDYSAKRLHQFRNDLATNENAQQAMENRTKLRTLCETRWSSRADALKTFKASLPVVVSSLEYLKDDGDDKAGTRLGSILRFEFIIGLVVTEHILSSTVSLSNYLQAPTCDLLHALNESKVVIQMLRNERADETVWDALYDESVAIAAEFDIPPSTPRRTGIQRQRANPMVGNTKDYWKITLYLVFLDHLVTELETRLIDSEGRFKGEALLPSKLASHLNDEMIQAIYDANTYDADLTDPDSYRQEIQRWITRWSMVSVEEQPTDIVTCLNLTDPQLYPNVTRILSLLLTMPVTTATAERSFSSRKRVKTYLRSTMTTERLSSLATLHIHREQEVDISRTVESFANAKSGKRLAHFI